MFIDMSLQVGGGGSGAAPTRWAPCCHHCHAPIHDDDIHLIQFPQGSAHALQQLNGYYHHACARPVLTMKRAHEVRARMGL